MKNLLILFLFIAAGQAGYSKAIASENKLSGGTQAIRLLSFDVIRLNLTKAKLNWKLDPFQQADKYIVLKSQDGLQFREMATVSSNSTAVYAFDDEALVPGTTYYKLAMIENNVDTTESKTIAVTNGRKELQITSWQQTAGGAYVFLMHSSERILLNWQVIDIAGRIMYSGSRQLIPGINPVILNMSVASRGAYYFRYSHDGGAEPAVHIFYR